MRQLICLPLFFALLTLAVAQQDCSQYDKQDTTWIWRAGGQAAPYPGDGQQGHSTGNHEFSYDLGGSCSYSGSTPGQQCAITCTSTADSPFGSDTGTISPRFYYHDIDVLANIGQAQAPGGGVTVQCASTAAAAVRSCPLSCTVTISFSGSQSGVGISVNFPSDAIFARSAPENTYCGPQQLPSCSGSPPFACCTGSPTCSNGQWSCGNSTECLLSQIPHCNYGSAYCDCTNGWTCPNGSPIIIDTRGTGFQFSSVSDGVRFDLNPATGAQEFSWPTASSGNGWLALPHDGKVETGADLFGNFSPQSCTTNQNGFCALADYDKAENGGNGDGIIDWHDAIYSKLRVWIDENHDGIAQPKELYTLPQVGVLSIGLTYTESAFVDSIGNQFKLKGSINVTGNPPGDHIDRVIYDVFLQSLPKKGWTGEQQTTRDLLKDSLLN